MKKVETIIVTNMHIAKGTQKSCGSCAIALALLDHYKKATWVQVYGGDNILVDNEDIHVMAGDKFVVQKFIDRFDINKSIVKPFAFKIINSLRKG